MGCGQSSQAASPQHSTKGTENDKDCGNEKTSAQQGDVVRELNKSQNSNADGVGQVNPLKTTNEISPFKRTAVNPTHVPTNSQVDFFQMLDRKIESGPDYVSINEVS